MKRLIVIALFLVFVPMTISAGTKPVDVKDYNGTYFGAPGTGTYVYTTLYRDNEDNGASSGCSGEGCGSHPGVDIGCPSGTLVRAAFSGTVSRAEYNCASNGWGGLITIQSSSPYNGETIYHSYGHLKSIYVSVGQWVPEGFTIGLSGGASWDYCPGNSSGSHLHFQIDANTSPHEAHTVPYFPNNVNSADSSFQVTRYTYNPILFVTGYYRWTFDQDAELWQMINIPYWGIGGGSLGIDGATDPWLWRNPDARINCGKPSQCTGGIAAEANIYRYVELSLGQFYCVSNPVKIYFITKDSPNWSEDKMVSFNYNGANTYNIYMAGNPNWNGIVKGIRFDPAMNCYPFASDPDTINEIKLKR